MLLLLLVLLLFQRIGVINKKKEKRSTHVMFPRARFKFHVADINI